MCHLLRGVRRSWRCLKVLVRAHVRTHLSELLVLGLLGTTRVHHVTAFTELLQVFLKAQLGVGQVLLLLLLLLLRWWCFNLVDIRTRPAAHLRVGVCVRRHGKERAAVATVARG